MEAKNIKDVQEHFYKLISLNMESITNKYIEEYNDEHGGRISKTSIKSKLSDILVNLPAFPKGNEYSDVKINNFGRHLSYHKASLDKDVKEPPKLPEICAFCDFFNIEISYLLRDLSEDNVNDIITAKLNKSTKKETKENNNPIMNFLNSCLNNSNFIFDFKENDQITSLIPFEQECHFIHLCVNEPQNDYDKQKIYRGKICFKINNGICCLTAHCENSIGQENSEYKGFGLITKSAKNNLFWGFMKLNNAPSEIMIICFNLNKGETNWNTMDWNARIVQVMSINNENEPAMYRLILTKEYIKDDEFKNFFKGLITLNIVSTPVKTTYYDALYSYANNTLKESDNYFKELEEHFKNTELSSIKRILYRYFAKEEPPMQIYDIPTTLPDTGIDSGNAPNYLIEYVLIRTWLRKHEYSISSLRNVAERTDDRNAETIYQFLKKYDLI